MKRAGIALTLAVALVATGVSAAGAGGGGGGIATGFVTGREHEVRLRPVLTDVPSEAAKIKGAAKATGEGATASCDPLQVTDLRRKVPTTPRDGDDPTACVVLETPNDKRAERLMLGVAPLTGSELGRVSSRRARGGNRLLSLQLTERGETLWAFFGAENGDADLAFTLDGEVVGLVELSSGSSTFLLGGRRGFPKNAADQIARLVEQAQREEVIELGRAASLSKAGRELYAANHPVIRERSDFADDCPLPEADGTFVLGCYDGLLRAISIRRIDRLDIEGVMPVTVAHEVLHAAYDGLSRRERERVDTMLEELLAESPQPQIEESLALYTEKERANEVHSLAGTEIRTLPPALERHYKRYFDDRDALVTVFEGYQRVFDELETRFQTLEFELGLLEGQLNTLESQANAAGAEADRLTGEIDALRAQGRIDESNNLVGPQNAAVDRANSLNGQYNAVVNDYNAKIDELNEIAMSLGDLYSDVGAFEPIR
jgi:hypothetical protein